MPNLFSSSTLPLSLSLFSEFSAASTAVKNGWQNKHTQKFSQVPQQRRQIFIFNCKKKNIYLLPTTAAVSMYLCIFSCCICIFEVARGSWIYFSFRKCATNFQVFVCVCGKRKSQSQSPREPISQVTMDNFLLKSQFDSLETQRERQRAGYIYFVKELKLLSSKWPWRTNTISKEFLSSNLQFFFWSFRHSKRFMLIIEWQWSRRRWMMMRAKGKKGKLAWKL